MKKLVIAALCLGVIYSENRAAEAAPADLVLQLHQAIVTRNRKRVSELIEEGVDVNAISPPFHTRPALISAIHEGLADIAKDLIDAGADLNKSFVGITPLMLAADRELPGLVGLLLNKGADPFLTDLNNRTALDRATSDEIKKLIQDSIEERKKRREEIVLALKESVEDLPADVADIIASQLTGIEPPKRKHVEPQQLTEEEQWLLSDIEEFAEWKKQQQE